MLNNETLLQKADAALADLTTGGGLLQPAQAQKFLRVLIDEAVLLKMATVTPMRSPKQLIEKIKFGSRILRAGTENEALSGADRSKPNLGKVELNAQLFKAEVRLNNEVVEDSIERGQLRQTIMQLMAEQIAVDIDEVLVKGDTTSTDPFLAQFDGLLAQIGSNQYDHTAGTANRTLFKHMMKAMPHPFIRNKKALRFLTSISAEIDYRDALGDRATVVGDRMVQEDAPTMYAGVPVVSVPLFPENIGTGSYCTDAVLIDPKNVTVGIWRDIRVETDKLVSEGVLLIVATMRFDMKLAHEPASVKAINVKINS
jgi:HK97 family phage major capsid protein